jgi:hypothetical protein
VKTRTTLHFKSGGLPRSPSGRPSPFGSELHACPVIRKLRYMYHDALGGRAGTAKALRPDESCQTWVQLLSIGTLSSHRAKDKAQGEARVPCPGNDIGIGNNIKHVALRWAERSCRCGTRSANGRPAGLTGRPAFSLRALALIVSPQVRNFPARDSHLDWPDSAILPTASADVGARNIA